jgi:hypothetical protein
MGNVFGYLRVDCDRSRTGSIVTLLFTAMAAGSSGNSLVMSALFAGPLQTLQVRAALLRLVHS